MLALKFVRLRLFVCIDFWLRPIGILFLESWLSPMLLFESWLSPEWNTTWPKATFFWIDVPVSLPALQLPPRKLVLCFERRLAFKASDNFPLFERKLPPKAGVSVGSILLPMVEASRTWRSLPAESDEEFTDVIELCRLPPKTSFGRNYEQKEHVKFELGCQIHRSKNWINATVSKFLPSSSSAPSSCSRLRLWGETV